jgi:oxalate decarboxylase/phosphoglucose isomerase-like protein (cupin superfamily)
VTSALLDLVEIVVGRRSQDERGWLHVALGASQLPAGTPFGELYLVRSEGVGVRRGDHLHRKMDEWFSVVEGRCILELLDPEKGERRSIPLDASVPRSVRVPAGLAHCLVNVGPGPMTAVAWATAEYDATDVIPCRTAGATSV